MNIEDKSLKNELLYFKEEILKDMRFELSKFTTKIDNQRDSFNQIISSLELKFSAISDKFIILSNSISEDKALKEKIKELNTFQNKTKDTLSFHDSKFKYQSKMIIDAMNRIDHFINESILYNDVIGPTPNCKFQNFHNFIDYIITNITQLNNFKEKTASNDIKSYKSKMDTALETLRTQIFNTSKGNNNYAKKLVEKEEEKINGMFNLYDEKITGLRMENSKYISNIKMNFENMQKEWEKITSMKKEIHEKIEKERNDVNKMNKYFESKLEEYHMVYLEQNQNLSKSIEELFNQIKSIKHRMKELNINTNSANIFIKENKGEVKMENKQENQQESKEKINEEIKGGININTEEKKELETSDKKVGTESMLKKYMDGKMNYEQISHFKVQKKLKSFEDKNPKNLKISYINDISNKSQNIKMNYLDILNNILNNPKIKSIYNTNNKDVQNFIDRIIIGSVVNSQIKTYENLNQYILNKLKNNNLIKNFEKEKNKNQNFKFNENLKFDEHSLITNKDNANSSNNDNLYDKIFESIKENIHNNYKNNSLRMTMYKKNFEINNKRESKNLMNGKNNSNSQVLFLKNDLEEKENNLKPSITLRKVPFKKKINTNNDVNKNDTFDNEKNNTSENFNIESINRKMNKDKITKNNNEENNKIINIINYSNKSQSQRLISKKNKSQSDSSMPSLFENKRDKPKLKLIKHDKNSFKNNFSLKNLTNKMPKSNLSIYDSMFNNRYNRNKLEIIAVKQVENSVKNIESQEN